MLCAYLVCLEPGYTPDASRFRNITENTDKFFRKPINDSLEVWSCDGTEGWEVRLIRLFKGAQCRVVACAVKLDALASDYLSQPKTPEPKKADSDDASRSRGEIAAIDAVIGRALGRHAKFDYTVRSRVVWLKGDIEDQVWQASYFLRGSTTLTAQSFDDVNHTRFVADARGVAVVDKSFDSATRAKNLLTVVALASAYQAVLNDAIEALAIAGSESDGEAIPEIRKWSKFLAAYYFKEPVRTTTVELVHLYSKIRDRQRLSAQYEEATDQLRLLSDLAQIERSEQTAVAITSRAATLSRQGRTIGIVGVIVGFAGVVVAAFAILQVTPKAVADFYSGWRKCFTDDWSYATCFVSTPEPLGLATPVPPPVKIPPKKQLKKSPIE